MDEVKTNLEPIDESDLDLKDKFLGGNNKKEQSAPKRENESSAEKMPSMENALEQKERKEGEAEKEAAYAKISSASPSPQTPHDDQISSDASFANQEKDAQSKVTALVNLAETKGVPHAVKVAKHMEDNYVLDEFHDRLLTEELHNALVQKGLVKEI